MCPFAECEEIQKLSYIVSSMKSSACVFRARNAFGDLIFASPLSSLKLALIAALSFCTTALSSAMVLEARTLRMNCFTIFNCQLDMSEDAFAFLFWLTGTHSGVLSWWILPTVVVI